MLTAMAKEKVTFRALAVMDSGERGTVRFVPEDYDAGNGVLQSMNVHYEVADVLLTEMPNQSGAFRKVCEKLAGEHLNIDYAYCSFANGKGTRAGVLAVVRVERPYQRPSGCSARRRWQLGRFGGPAGGRPTAP